MEMTKMNYKDALKEAEKICLDNNDLNQTISIKHLDGSVLSFTHSVYKLIDEWILISTEHHGFFAYHIEDLECAMVKSMISEDNYDSMAWSFIGLTK